MEVSLGSGSGGGEVPWHSPRSLTLQLDVPEHQQHTSKDLMHDISNSFEDTYSRVVEAARAIQSPPIAPIAKVCGTCALFFIRVIIQSL
jgi:hypothetical protein